MTAKYKGHDPHGPMGGRRPHQSPYKDLRLWRRKANRNSRYPAYITVQLKSGDGWISLVDFDTENEAVEFLVQEAKKTEQLKEWLSMMEPRKEHGGFDE